MSTTITSLLNSLQSHLQSQTQLLPTLHTQLGLPPTALADDLSTLERQLTECVESQVSARKQQVDEWMGRCDEMESNCIRYGKALGNHVKATGSSVGEIRKEQVLPRRFDMITEYQEKLRQLYHTKLEQLLTLTNRIATLSRILGPQFYSPEILDPVIADGEDEIEPDAYRDVTPERFSKLEKELVRGKSEVGKRLHSLSTTLVQIDYLYSELGIPPPSPNNPSASTSYSSTRPPSFGSMLAASSGLNDPFLCSIRASTPTPASRGKSPMLLTADSTPSNSSDNEYQAIFARFVVRLEELGDDEVQDPAKPTVGLEGVDPSPGLLSWAERTRIELEDLKRKRESHIQSMYDQLEALWKRLSISEAEMDEFVEANRGSTEETIGAYEEELDRMLELKRERMSTFVENARAEISSLWDDLMVSEEERADFAPFADDEHTEELLAIHEEEVRKLKEERRLKGTLLTNIRKYFDICQEEKELAAAASDQTRLLGRGPRDPGRLLREEKMRKRVTKEKPRLAQDLLASIPAWETETGRTFLVNGESILQILQQAAVLPEKDNGKRKSRAGSAPPRSKTPSTNSLNNSRNAPPIAGPSNAVTPAVRPASSMSRTGPTKRPKLNESTNAQTMPRLRSASKQPPASTTKTNASLLRPRSIASTNRTVATPTPRNTNTSVAHGAGRVPSVPRHHSRNYHPYPQSHRSTSTMSTRSATAAAASSAASFSVMGSMALNSLGGGGGGAIRKASRAKRESFKPRPSMDDNWDMPPAPVAEGQKRWAGFTGGAVQEEDEDF
ncbi:microtubule associated protein-domain-containing protein [Irpex rosettiformis]|uniref:Microtubule associated protein-domain-containing protein n=1 Tax=Irpex rosettiformis TaxID=378272 RepID=A0ACB8TZ42_9APHY|nr:microtubule associated protein-domain-containing protein [Irpex rosettiformis]